MTIYNMTLSTTEPYNNVGAVTVRQDDNLTQTFVATIVENGTRKKDLSGYQVFFNALFDGNIIARDLAEFNYGTSTATYTLKDSFFQQTGEVEAYFSFEKDGKRDSTANFSYYVTAGNCRNIRQGNYIYELEELFSVSEDIIKNKDFTILLEENRKLNDKLDEIKTGFDSRLTKAEEKFDSRLTKAEEKFDNYYTKGQVDDYTFFNKKLIWEGASYFRGDKHVDFDANLMKRGVYIVFSSYDPTEMIGIDVHYHEAFVSIETIIKHNRKNFRFLMTDGKSQKVLYLGTNKISGNDANSDENNLFAVREIWVV